MAQTPPAFLPATTHSLNVTIGDIAVTPGLYVPIQTLRDPAVSPAVDFTHIERCSSHPHVIVMIDLDTPMGEANRSYAPYLHWLTPIPSGVKSLASNDSTTSATSVAPYVAPNPPAGSDPHRYVVMLFNDPKQEFSMPAEFEGKTYDTLLSRINFDLDGFMTGGDFELAAANWFTTKPAQ